MARPTLFTAASVLLGALCLAVPAMAADAPPPAAGMLAAGTLAAVRGAGTLRCGSDGAIEDYTRADSHGDLTDLAVEICRAVAVAVLGPQGKTDLHVWPDEQHMLQSLRDRSTDLAIGVAPTLVTAIAFDVGFAAPVFDDGQALLVRNGIDSMAGLAGQQICFVNDASLGEDLRLSMRNLKIDYKPFPFEEVGEMLNAAGSGRCGAITGDVSQLANMRLGFGAIDKQFHLLADRLTQDPVAPAFRADDRPWGIIVTAVVGALLQAEASGITAANADQRRGDDDPAIRQLIGPGGHLGRLMGLSDDWALAVIKAVGNYGEVYDRALGAGSEFKLPRTAGRPVAGVGSMHAPSLF